MKCNILSIIIITIMNKSKITATDENKNNKKMKSYLGQKGYTL